MDSTNIKIEDLPRIVSEMDKKLNRLLESQHNANSGEEYLTRKEVMERLKIGSYNTIINLEKDQVLNPIPVGRKKLYKKSEVDNLGNQQLK